MNPVSPISRKAHALRERFARVPRANLALVTVLAVVALPGGTAATAHASATAPAAATCSVSGESPVIDEHHGTPLFSYVPGNGNVNLFFDNSGDASCFYAVPYFKNGAFYGYQIYGPPPADLCLAVDTATMSIHEATATACAQDQPYTVWHFLPTSPSTSGYQLFQNDANHQCLYDDTQRPATYSTCTATDQFEWMTLSSQMP